MLTKSPYHSFVHSLISITSPVTFQTDLIYGLFDLKMNMWKKMQWLQQAKVTIIYSQNIVLNDNTIYLSFFSPSHCLVALETDLVYVNKCNCFI